MQIQEEHELYDPDLCQSCGELGMPPELCHYGGYKDRRSHALTHILAETGDVVEYGLNGDRKQSIRRAIFAAFPATEEFAELPPKERRGLVFGSVFADLQRRDERRRLHWTPKKRAVNPPKPAQEIGSRKLPRVVHTPDSQSHPNHVSNVSEIRKELFNFCSICGRGYLRSGGGAVNHALWHQEKHFIFCPQCPFSHKFDSRIVLAHIEAEHPESDDAPIDRRMDEPDQLSAIVSAAFPTKKRSVVRPLPPTDGLHIECQLCGSRLRALHAASIATLHCRQHHLDNPGVTCPRCAKTFTFAGGFRAHAIATHGSDTLEPILSREEACRLARQLRRLAFPGLELEDERRRGPRDYADSGLRLHNCLICKADIPAAYRKSHAIRHIPREKHPFSCCICAWRGSDQKAARLHSSSHGEFAYDADLVQEYWLKCGWKLCQKPSIEPTTGVQCSKCETHISRISGRFGRLTHILSHLKQRLFSCTLCSFSYSNKNRVFEHLKSDHQISTKEYICNNTKLPRTQALLNDYFPNHTNSIRKVTRCRRTWKCVKCGDSVRGPERTRHIVNIHKRLPSFHCQVCSYGFNSYGPAKSHADTAHPEVDENTVRFVNNLADHAALLPEFFPKEKQSGMGFGFNLKCGLCGVVVRKAEKQNHVLAQHWPDGQARPSQLNCPANGCAFSSLSAFSLQAHVMRSLDGHDDVKNDRYPEPENTAAHVEAMSLIRRCFPSRRSCTKWRSPSREGGWRLRVAYAPGVITADNRIRCQLCRKSFLRTSVATHSHPRDVHFPIPLYECRFCDRTFRRHWIAKLHGLKEHPGQTDVIFSHIPAKRAQLSELQRRCFPRLKCFGKLDLKPS